MKIEHDDKFAIKMSKIWHFIALDSQNRANTFKSYTIPYFIEVDKIVILDTL